jgi:hypothetical protein
MKTRSASIHEAGVGKDANGGPRSPPAVPMRCRYRRCRRRLRSRSSSSKRPRPRSSPPLDEPDRSGAASPFFQHPPIRPLPAKGIVLLRAYVSPVAHLGALDLDSPARPQKGDQDPSTGDFQEAPCALLGKDAPNLSPAVAASEKRDDLCGCRESFWPSEKEASDQSGGIWGMEGALGFPPRDIGRNTCVSSR